MIRGLIDRIRLAREAPPHPLTPTLALLCIGLGVSALNRYAQYQKDTIAAYNVELVHTTARLRELHEGLGRAERSAYAPDGGNLPEAAEPEPVDEPEPKKPMILRDAEETDSQ